jgi:hypothetical protein
MSLFISLFGWLVSLFGLFCLFCLLVCSYVCLVCLVYLVCLLCLFIYLFGLFDLLGLFVCLSQTKSKKHGRHAINLIMIGWNLFLNLSLISIYVAVSYEPVGLV